MLWVRGARGTVTIQVSWISRQKPHCSVLVYFWPKTQNVTAARSCHCSGFSWSSGGSPVPCAAASDSLCATKILLERSKREHFATLEPVLCGTYIAIPLTSSLSELLCEEMLASMEPIQHQRGQVPSGDVAKPQVFLSRFFTRDALSLQRTDLMGPQGRAALERWHINLDLRKGKASQIDKCWGPNMLAP